jgi:hypothetical protein
MSFNAQGIDLTFNAGSDLSAQQYRIVKLTSSDLAVANATDLNQVGVLQDNGGSAAGRPSLVRVFGPSKVKLGGTVVKGDRLTSDASGNAIVAASTKQVVGIAMTAGVSGDIGNMFVSPRGVV